MAHATSKEGLPRASNAGRLQAAPGKLTLTRRQFCATGALLLAGPAALLRAAEPDPEPHPFSSFDREMEEFMRLRGVPGGSLAVVKDRRLVYAKGYGWANRESQTPAQPDTLFRIASISKPITAIAILRLMEQGRLDLEAKGLEAAGLGSGPGAVKVADKRLKQVTVRQLLQHTAGWDRAQSGDPMFRWKRIAKEQSVTGPPDPIVVIRHMLGRQLDFDPGARYAYSNFGYCLLGRVIEKVTGKSYEEYVRETVLAPLGCARMRIGDSLKSGADEAHYYTARNNEVESVFPQAPDRVPEPYGGFSMSVMDAHGGWVASAVDLARLAAALDDSAPNNPLKTESRRLMQAPPPPPAWRKKDGTLESAYCGCGWMVRPMGSDGRANCWHTGSLPGTYSLLVRRWDSLSWAALFNQRSNDRKLPDDAIDPALHRAAARWRDGETGKR